MRSETRTFSQSAALYPFLRCCEKDGADSEKCMEIDFLKGAFSAKHQSRGPVWLHFLICLKF